MDKNKTCKLERTITLKLWALLKLPLKINYGSATLFKTLKVCNVTYK